MECDLLYGIVSAADRYDAYSTPGKMEWGRSLKVGDTVLAQLSEHSASDGGQQGSTDLYGTSHYINSRAKLKRKYQFATPHNLPVA